MTGASVGSLERSGGCLGAAIEQIYGTFDARVRYVSLQSTLVRIGVDLLDRVRASPEMQELNQQWSECMRESGYDFADPFAPSSYPWPEPAPSDQERAAAGADVTCKQAVGYLGAAQRLVSDEVAASSSSVAGLTQDLDDLTVQVLANAKAVLGE